MPNVIQLSKNAINGVEATDNIKAAIGNMRVAEEVIANAIVILDASGFESTNLRHGVDALRLSLRIMDGGF